MARMKRLQISLEHDLDLQLGKAAREQGVSKAEVVRQSLVRSLGTPSRIADDPLFKLRFRSPSPRQPGQSFDDLIYGQGRDEAKARNAAE